MKDPLSLRRLLGRGTATISEVFEARCAQSGSATFLVWQGRRWTYSEARREIVALAGYLQRLAGSGELRVATYLGNSPETMWGWLACAYAGAICVPLNRGHKGALLGDMLKDSGASVLITDSEGLLAFEMTALSRVQAVLLTDGDTQLAQADIPARVGMGEARDSDNWRMPQVSPGSIACVMFTSGTTGRSKGVRVPHNQYCRGAAWLVDAFGLGTTDVLHNWLPLFHLGGQLHMTMCAVVSGGAVALFPGFSTSAFAEEVESTGATVLCGFTAILHFMDSLPQGSETRCKTLRVGIFAGIPPDLGRRIAQRFGMRLGENYGMTEADPVTMPEPGVRSPDGSAGRGTPDFELAIVDADGRPVEPGVLGEIAFRPRQPDVMMAGYENASVGGSRAWRGEMFCTGDMGVLDADGFLFFRGRGMNYIRRRGENVSVDEVIDILQRHPKVKECAVVGVPSDVGEDDIKAIFVMNEPVEPGELHRFATDNMARFMVPRYIEFASLIPRTDLGKLNIAELRRLGEGVWDARQEFADTREPR